MRPDVRLEKERELATKKAELEEAQMKRERGIMVGRYHMVRFFGMYMWISVRVAGSARCGLMSIRSVANLVRQKERELRGC